MTTLRFPSMQFRSIAAPVGSSKVGLFYTAAEKVPPELWNWRDVNPREVSRRSSVYKQIVSTLRDEPERFHERNRGITVVAEDLVYDDKKKEVVLTLADHHKHGAVDGGHTLDGILETQKSPPENGWPAYVFIKAITGVDGDQIAEIAGGLNTSQQVDLKSLENLEGHFDRLRKVLSKESYAESIAYKMNEDRPVDVREVLYYLALFDCSEYTQNNHPVRLFGRKEGIVRRFAEQAKSPKASNSFNILISRAPEILKLRDTIEKRALALKIGQFNAGKGIRVRSDSNKDNHLQFLNVDVSGKIPLGWLIPILAGFRANVAWNEPKNSFSWVMPIEELVDASIERLVAGIKEIHESENSRPEYVGRNATAWRMSYGTVSTAILEWQLARARSGKS